MSSRKIKFGDKWKWFRINGKLMIQHINIYVGI